MEVTFVSETEAEVKLFSKEGKIFSFFVKLDSDNIIRDIRKMAQRDGHTSRSDGFRVPIDLFKQARQLAARAITEYRQTQSFKSKCVVDTQVALRTQEVTIDISWDRRSVQFVFGIAKGGRTYFKTKNTEVFVPESVFTVARESAEKAALDALGDKAYAPKIERAMARTD